MSWAVGTDSNHRWIGYGVPAVCDQQECGAIIDRGMAYRCGSFRDERSGCGGFFCPAHLTYDEKGEEVCDRCLNGQEPYPETPDTAEWITHMLTDESWQQWRDENPAQVEGLKTALAETSA